MLGTLFRWTILAIIGYGMYLLSLVIWRHLAPVIIPAGYAQYTVIAGYIFSAILVWYGAQAIFGALYSLFIRR